MYSRLGHCGSVEVHEVVQWYRQTCGYVPEPYKGLIYFFSFKPVSEKLLGSSCHVFKSERSSGRCLYELLHQRVGLGRAAEHGAEAATSSC